MKKTSLEIAVDFDGTCVTNGFPGVGKEIGADYVLKKLVNAGHKIILFTVRTEEDQIPAVEWFEHHAIPLFGVNENPDQKLWMSNIEKIYYDILIDDRSLGIPLRLDPTLSAQPFVDWFKVDDLLREKGIY